MEANVLKDKSLEEFLRSFPPSADDQNTCLRPIELAADEQNSAETALNDQNMRLRRHCPLPAITYWVTCN